MTNISETMARRIQLASQSLHSIAAGEGFDRIVSAVEIAVPSVSSVVEFLPGSDPWNSVAHISGFPQDVLEWMMGAYALDITPAQLVASPATKVISKATWYEGMVNHRGREVADWWEYNKTRIFGLGDHINIKLSISPAALDVEHMGLSVFRARGEAMFSEEETASLVQLAPLIADALRLQQIPVTRGQPLLSSLMNQSHAGFALLDTSGRIRELNRSFIEMVCAYLMRDNHKTHQHLMDYVLNNWMDRWKRGGEARFLADALPGGTALIVSWHLLSAAVHSLPGDRYLIWIEPAGRLPHLGDEALEAFRQLTDREREIGRWLTDTSFSVRDIAVRLGITPSTVRKHTEAIYRSCKVRSRSELRTLRKNVPR